MDKKIKLGLIPRLIIAIIIGILAGLYLPVQLIKIAVTFSSIFSAWLGFIIPLMILAFVTKGIADLSEGAGKLLGVTVAISYVSTLIAGSASWAMSYNIFPRFITSEAIEQITSAAGDSLEPIFKLPLSPFFDVTGALIFAFAFGLSVSWLRSKGRGEYSYGFVDEFNEIITNLLSKAVIPILPVFIFGNFANMAYSGSVFAILSIFWKIFIFIIALHIIYITLMFVVAGAYTKRNPFEILRNSVPAYITAIGTQSSAATIPVTIACSEKNGVSKEIREFAIPLCATVHMPGSMITITGCTFTILAMYGMSNGFRVMLPFIATLGVAMVAAPGAPGGAVMSALPFLTIVGIDPTSIMATLLISLYTTQDSFGTAANVTGDNAVALIVDKFYSKNILKK